MSQFRDTRNNYLQYLSDFTFPLTYEAWLNADDEYKAVLLFVNFFDEIELAWYKTRFSFVVEDDAVSQINVYLMKNIEFIKKDPKRFRPNYIYTVAANCLRSLTYIERDINREKFDVAHELDVGSENGDVVNLYDLAPHEDDPYEVRIAKEAVWDIVDKMTEELGPKVLKVINRLINPEDSLRASGSRAQGDSLKDVSVSADEYDSILAAFRSNSSFLANLEFIANGAEHEISDPKREEFVNEISNLKVKLSMSDISAKEKKAYKAQLKEMEQELADYDNFRIALG